MTPSLPGLFLGTSEHPVDKKGRMSFAKRFQDVIDRDQDRHTGILVLEPTHGRCIWVFNGAGFREELQRLGTGAIASQTEPSGDGDVDGQRDFFEFVEPFQLDTSGRLVLPARFREIAGIDDVVVSTGVGSRAEIWAKDDYDARQRGERSPLYRGGPQRGGNA